MSGQIPFRVAQHPCETQSDSMVGSVVQRNVEVEENLEYKRALTMRLHRKQASYVPQVI